MKTLFLAITLLICLSSSVVFGQGEVFLFGQLMSSASTSKIQEVTRLKTNTPLVTISTTTNPLYKGKIVAYNNSTRVLVSTIATNLRHISASITDGEVPNGASLSLCVLDPNDNFNGESGIFSSEIKLMKADRVIVSEIGTCYSGKNISDGYGIEYSFTTHSSLINRKATSNKVTVTLTIASDV